MDSIAALLSWLAVALGIAHGIYLYRQEVATFRSTLHDHPLETRLRASYYALWALVLWVVLGSYVLGYWVLAIVPYLVARAMGKTLPTPSVQTAR
jgi:hypothetical protein